MKNIKQGDLVLIEITNDFAADGDPTAPVEVGTKVSAWIDPISHEAWYDHPITGEDWLSLEGDYKEVTWP